ncbi:putative DNA topoisomerase [Helianthus debilis subsp. tardiflorus]
MLPSITKAGKQSKPRKGFLKGFQFTDNPISSFRQAMAASGGGGRAIRVLNVAEKPSVAKTVSGILSRNQGLRMREGRSRYNKIFEFNYTIQG